MDIAWGLVENVDDPIKAQRVQVRIYGYYDNLNKDELPWCQVLRSATDTLTFGVGKSSHELVPGSQVLCGWLDNNFQQPIVLGQVPRIDDCADQTDINKQVYKTKGGHEISIDDDTIFVKDKRSNLVQMDKEGITIKAPISALPVDKGSITEEAEGSKTIKVGLDFDITVTGNTSITTTGNTNIKSSGTTNIEGSEVNVKSSGKVSIDGGQVSIKNISGPNQFCCLPNCLFTGGKHIMSSTD